MATSITEVELAGECGRFSPHSAGACGKETIFQRCTWMLCTCTRIHASQTAAGKPDQGPHHPHKCAPADQSVPQVKRCTYSCTKFRSGTTPCAHQLPEDCTPRTQSQLFLLKTPSRHTLCKLRSTSICDVVFRTTPCSTCVFEAPVLDAIVVTNPVTNTTDAGVATKCLCTGTRVPSTFFTFCVQTASMLSSSRHWWSTLHCRLNPALIRTTVTQTDATKSLPRQNKQAT